MPDSPTVDALVLRTVLFGIFRWAHLLAMALLVGGCWALRYGLRRAVQPDAPTTEVAALETARRGLAATFLVALAILFVSGLVNLIRAFVVPPAPPTAYHMILGIKLLLATVLFVVVAAYCWPSAPPNRFQRRPRLTLSLVAHLGMLIIALSVALRFLSGK